MRKLPHQIISGEKLMPNPDFTGPDFGAVFNEYFKNGTSSTEETLLPPNGDNPPHKSDALLALRTASAIINPLNGVTTAEKLLENQSNKSD